MTDDSEIILRRWQDGDRQALAALLERHREWIEHRIRERMGDVLRNKAETVDYAQSAVLDLLRYVPPIPVRSTERFRGLVLRIIDNNLRDAAEYHATRKRDARREQRLPEESQLWTDPRLDSELARREMEALLRLAIELLPETDRRVLLLREWERQGYRDIGQALGLSEDAARMRFQRALPRLGELIRRLQKGELDFGEPPAG
ncbi:MAG: sigma-70 family RNA polymerase sigma factor [Planctomycetota bacterium]